MCSIESKRDEFRQYLEGCGFIDNISKALIQLYEEPNKPEDVTKFIRKRLCESCPDEEEFDAIKIEMEEARIKIQKLKKELNSLKGNIKRTSSEIQLSLDNGITALEENEECKSLLKKYLNREIFNQLKELKTSFKSTLLDCIQSGFENHDSGVGIYAPDAEAYTLFADIFDPIIEDYHKGFAKTDSHPAHDWGDLTTFEDLDPQKEFIISTRVRCGRSVDGYPFNPCLNEHQYIEIMEKVQNALECLEDDYKGKFYPLEGMDKETQQKLIDDHFLFKEGDRFLQSANASRFWPVGRGIFFNDSKTFLVWCNEEDHLRIISMEGGGNVGAVYSRLVDGVDKISEQIKFSTNERLGFLTFCPSNLGTTIRASVHIKLPKLAADRENLEKIAAEYNLQVRGTAGEHTEGVGGVYDISNKRRMGLTEYEAVKEMNDGISKLIEMEREAPSVE